MLGLFLLALVAKKPSRAGAIAGVALGLCVIAYMSLPVFHSPVHTYLTIVFGTTTIFIIGFLFTKLFTPKDK